MLEPVATAAQSHCMRLTVNYAKQRSGSSRQHCHTHARVGLLASWDEQRAQKCNSKIRFTFCSHIFLQLCHTCQSYYKITRKPSERRAWISKPDVHFSVLCSISERSVFCGYSSITINTDVTGSCRYTNLLIKTASVS